MASWSRVKDIAIVLHFFACSSYQSQRLNTSFVGAGHICNVNHTMIQARIWRMRTRRRTARQTTESSKQQDKVGHLVWQDASCCVTSYIVSGWVFFLLSQKIMKESLGVHSLHRRSTSSGLFPDQGGSTQTALTQPAICSSPCRHKDDSGCRGHRPTGSAAASSTGPSLMHWTVTVKLAYIEWVHASHF